MPPKATLTIPEDFTCPITLDIMMDPVQTPDHRTYDRHAIVSWLERFRTTPVTELSVIAERLTSDEIMKQRIRIFVEENKHFFYEKLIAVINKQDEVEEYEKWKQIWKFIGLGINLADVQDEQGWSLLHHATYYNYQEMALTLIDNGCSVGQNTATFEVCFDRARVPTDEAQEALAAFFPKDDQHICITQCTPLLLAIYCGHLEIVKRFFAEKPDLNQVDGQGCTYLHWAAFCGDEDILTELLKHDVNCQVRNKQGKRALDFAHLFGFTKGVALLEEKMKAEALLPVSASGAPLQEAAIAPEDVVEGLETESSRSATPLGCFPDAGDHYLYAFGMRREAVFYFDDPLSLDQMRFNLLLLYIKHRKEEQADSLVQSYPTLLNDGVESFTNLPQLYAQKLADLKARRDLGDAMQPPTAAALLP
jgi:hypothetical protein